MGTVLGWGTQDVDLPCYDDCWCLEWTKEVGVDRVQLVVVFFPMHLCWLYFRSKITEEWFSTLVPLWNHQEIKKTQTLFILGLSCSLVIRVFQTPGGLQSMGSLRVRHDWVTSLSLFTFMHWRRKREPTPVFLPGESQGWGNLVGSRLWGRTELDTTEAT